MENVGNDQKKCPRCAETIPLTAVSCTSCGAKFKVTRAGYCQTCHQVRDANEYYGCQRCGASLVDIRFKSELIEPAQQSIPPGAQAGSQLGQPRKKGFGTYFLGFMGACLVLTVICAVAFVYAMPGLSKALATETPRPIPTRTQTLTPVPTATRSRTPAPTSTPKPVEVSFDTINDYEKGTRVIMSGTLVMFGSTHCDSECGILLAESSNSSNKITIFVRVAAPGVEPSPNQMKALPDPYEKWDVRIRLNDGTFAFIGQRITVTGKICHTTDGDACISSITKIELAE